MASCDYCGTNILFGGTRDGEFRFCNKNCQSQGDLIMLANQLPQEMVDQHVNEVHQGQCPICDGSGPVDVYTSYKIWSMLVLTSWKSEPQISCRSCGTKSQIGSVFYCIFLGWWGFPWGIIMTPIQIIRNLMGPFTGPDPVKPSPQLEKQIRVYLAATVAESQSADQAESQTAEQTQELATVP